MAKKSDAQVLGDLVLLATMIKRSLLPGSGVRLPSLIMLASRLEEQLERLATLAAVAETKEQLRSTTKGSQHHETNHSPC
jgi:hypothetical protein